MENCYISEITVAELIYGREYGKLKGGPKYRDEKLEQFFEDINVLPVAPVFERYGTEIDRPTGGLSTLNKNENNIYKNNKKNSFMNSMLKNILLFIMVIDNSKTL